MLIKKDTKLKVEHQRTGTFIGIAEKDFDTELEEFYPIKLHSPNEVFGISTLWNKGETIPCRNCLVRLTEWFGD